MQIICNFTAHFAGQVLEEGQIFILQGLVDVLVRLGLTCNVLGLNGGHRDYSLKRFQLLDQVVHVIVQLHMVLQGLLDFLIIWVIKTL